jgi:hypothetical protein
VDADGQGFDEGGVLERALVGELVHVAVEHGARDPRAFSERARDAVADAALGPRLAQVVPALEALLAIAAQLDRQAGHAIADRNALDLGADMNDLTGELVAHDLALFGEQALRVGVQVRAADAAGLDVQDNVPRPRIGIGHILDRHLPNPSEDTGAHRPP